MSYATSFFLYEKKRSHFVPVLGEPATFTVTVTPQRNLPLDLYILIDVSSSMREELNTVQAISTLIGEGYACVDVSHFVPVTVLL